MLYIRQRLLCQTYYRYISHSLVSVWYMELLLVSTYCICNGDMKWSIYIPSIKFAQGIYYNKTEYRIFTVS